MHAVSPPLPQMTAVSENWKQHTNLEIPTKMTVCIFMYKQRKDYNDFLSQD